ncbi:Reverse transcriptase domain [Cinara cedri]|uniref:Reverse transcriptase domain n=1 Tax=Cinara cedri TaxID=506608 RepID=A0A5E4M8G4_9HEMI|nr:Reverse transcriptase domain [Cinara cedri]
MCKVLSGLILNRIKPYAKDIVGDYQYSFIIMWDHTFTVKQLVEKHYEFDKDLNMLFIEHKQAYHLGNSVVQWNALIIFRIPAKTLRMIKLCMDKTSCKVRFNQHLADEFEVKIRIRQGNSIFPVFFNEALETVIRKTQNKYRGLHLEDNEKQYGILAYTDDNRIRLSISKNQYRGY